SSGIVTTARIMDEERSCGPGGVKVMLGLNKIIPRLVDAALGLQRRRPVRRLEAPKGFRYVFDQGIVFMKWTPGDADRWEVWWTQETDSKGDPTNFVLIQIVGQPRYEHEGLEVGSDNWYMLYARQGQRRSEA